MSSENDKERAFVKEVRKTLQEKGERLDPEILVKLTAIRSGVVEGRSSSFFHIWRYLRVPAAGAFVAAMVLVFSMVFYQGPMTMQNSFSGLEDIEILISEESPDFYAELDFYSWLARQEQNDA